MKLEFLLNWIPDPSNLSGQIPAFEYDNENIDPETLRQAQGW
ncbi:MAG: hypothetical protein ACRENO_01070 [Thermodesulfobacteriota bacterium]